MQGNTMKAIRSFNARNETARMVLLAAVTCSGFHGATLTALAIGTAATMATAAILMLDRRTAGFLSNRGGALMAAGGLIISVAHLQGYAPWVSGLSVALLALAALEAFEITHDAFAVAVPARGTARKI